MADAWARSKALSQYIKGMRKLNIRPNWYEIEAFKTGYNMGWKRFAGISLIKNKKKITAEEMLQHFPE
jgi:hypothetical protein